MNTKVIPAFFVGERDFMGLFGHGSEKPKKQKVLSMDGEYYGSHPDFPKPERFMHISFSDNDIWIGGNRKKPEKYPPLKILKWEDITGYNYSDGTQENVNTSSRTTATRMATVGVFALAAPKKSKSINIAGKIVQVLGTKTGNFIFEKDINMSGGNNTAGFAELSMQMIQRNLKNIKFFIAEKLAGLKQ